MTEVYYPSESEKLRGKWAVVHERFEDGEPDWNSNVHIIPIYDTHLHEISDSCWCSPSKIENGTISHRVSQ